MKILVTGGAGFIGSHLVDSLVKKDHQVLVVDDLSTGREDYVNPRADFKNIKIETDDMANVFSNFEPDVVYHLAAQKNVRVSLKKPSEDAKTNIMGALMVLEESIKNNVKKFIFVSTGGIYGDTENLPTPEDGLEQPLSPYILNKLTFEKYLDILGTDKMKWASLRLANVYGPRQDPYGEAGVISIFFDNALKNETLYINGDGKQTRDFIYVADVVDVLIESLDKLEGVYNVGTGKEISVLDLIEGIKNVSGIDIKSEHRDAIPGEVIRSCLDSSNIFKALNWQPKHNLKDGLDLTYRWFKENK